MSYCKYHPLQAATNSCKQCSSRLCEHCIDTNQFDGKEYCLSCGSQVESLGVTVDADPFWRRIDKSFHYPLTSSVLAFIAIISLVSAVSSFLLLPLMIGINLLTAGIMLKYCFNCLTATAMGQMNAPDITTAYQGGILLVIRLLVAVAVLFGLIALVDAFISSSLAALLGFGIIIALPAMIILYAMTENLFTALNPIGLISLISNIGLPYILILAILFIMIGSVELISEIIGYQSSLWSLALQSAISNYYSIVMFNLMGYMIFQYQHRLGYTAKQSVDEPKKKRSEQQVKLAKIQVLTKEGHWEKVESLYLQALKQFPNEEELQHRYFLYILSVKLIKNRNAVQSIDDYMSYLIRSNQKDKLNLSYKRACVAFPKYLPATPLLRHEIAKACYDSGSPKITSKLLFDMHKVFPDYFQIVAAYELLVMALDHIPGMTAKANQCRKLIPILEECTKGQTSEVNSTKSEKHMLEQKQHAITHKPSLTDNSEITCSKPEEHNEELRDLPPIEFK